MQIGLFFIKYRQFGGAAYSLLGMQLAVVQNKLVQNSISILQNQKCIYSGFIKFES